MNTKSKIALAGLVLTCCVFATTVIAEWDQECVDLVESGSCTPAIGGVWGLCCSADGSCENIDSAECLWTGGTPGSPLECAGDSDGNGIDDACECDDFSTGCCLPDESCSQMLPEACEAMGGQPRGWCGADCWYGCAPAVCLTAEADCAETHDTPGCDDLLMCGCVCSQLPHCCGTTPNVPATSFRGMLAGAVLLLVASATLLLRRRRAEG